MAIPEGPGGVPWQPGLGLGSRIHNAAFPGDVEDADFQTGSAASAAVESYGGGDALASARDRLAEIGRSDDEDDEAIVPNEQILIDSSGAPLGGRFGAAGAESNRFGLGLAPAGGLAPMTPLQLLEELYDPGIDDETFRGIQEDLYVAGYFGQAEPDEVVWGDRDDMTTFSAWRSFVEDVSGRAELGDQPSWWNMLQAGVEQGQLQGRSLQPVSEEEERSGRVFSFTDPARIGQTLDAAADELLGRRVDPDMKRVFVKTIHDLQRQTQQDAFAAQEVGGPDVEVSTPDVAAQARQEILEENPDEAGAHAIGNVISALGGMIGG